MSEDGHGPGKTIRPGAFSELLRKLARAPSELCASWAKGLAPGEILGGRFEIVRELGRGGFGVVYEARDRRLRNRAVALKTVLPGEPERARLLEERLQMEGEAAAILAHPNLVTLYDVGGGDADPPYLVLELLRGVTLADRVEREPIPLRDGLRIATHVARGLAHAHAKGVLHRDLKPANVFLCEDGPVKLLDFGLAHALGQRRQDGGTPSYMAPEQCRTAPEDERTDVFALGVLVFRLVTGRLPFTAGDGKRWPWPRAAPDLEVPALPGLGPLVGRMLSEDPVSRPRDGTEALEALEALRSEARALEAASPAGQAAPPRVRARWRRHAPLVLVAALALAAGAAAKITSDWLDARQRPVVVIGDAVNPTGDPDLDGLGYFLGTSMEQSRWVNVVPRRRLLELAARAGHPATARLDEAGAREVSRLAGATLLLVPAVRRIGAVYWIELRGLDPRSGEARFSAHDQSPTKEGVLSLVDRLASQARRFLRDPVGEGSREQVPLPTLGGLDALALYRTAMEDQARLRLAEAAEGFRRALERDPGFALAHYQLARMGTVGEISGADRAEHDRAALALAGRLTPRERRLLEAMRASEQGRPAEAEPMFMRLAEDYPGDAEILLETGSFLLDRERPAEAVGFLDRVLQIEPTQSSAIAYLCRALGFLDLSDRLLAVARRSQALSPGPEASWFLSEAYLWAGRPADAAAAARDAIAHGEPQGNGVLILASLRLGDLRSAEEVVEQLERLASLGYTRAFVHESRAALAALRGQDRIALRELADGSAGAPGPYATFAANYRLAVAVGLRDRDAIGREARTLAAAGGGVEGDAAAAAAWAGEEAAGERLVAALGEDDLARALHAAVVRWRASRPEAALPALRKLAETHSSEGSFLDQLLLGEASLEAGHPGEAAEALLRFRRMVPPVRWASWTWPRSLLLLARAEEGTGDRAQARVHAGELAAMWRGADPDHPGLSELRALEERLGR